MHIPAVTRSRPAWYARTTMDSPSASASTLYATGTMSKLLIRTPYYSASGPQSCFHPSKPKYHIQILLSRYCRPEVCQETISSTNHLHGDSIQIMFITNMFVSLLWPGQRLIGSQSPGVVDEDGCKNWRSRCLPFADMVPSRTLCECFPCSVVDSSTGAT